MMIYRQFAKSSRFFDIAISLEKISILGSFSFLSTTLLIPIIEMAVLIGANSMAGGAGMSTSAVGGRRLPMEEGG